MFTSNTNATTGTGATSMSDTRTMDRSIVGRPIAEVPTPALLLDLAACDRNLRRMADFFRDRPCRLRPHFKNHKCTTLARRQLAAGQAVGMTCAKLGEAEVLVEHGFDDVLIANQVVGPPKMRRLAELTRRATVRVAVDAIAQVHALADAAGAAGTTIEVLLEVDIGMGRCGVAAGRPALELARAIAGVPGVRLHGIQAFEGHLVYVDDLADRTQRTRQAMQQAIETRALLTREGIPVDVISGGATSTYAIDGLLDGFDELQCGTYATMDWRYHQVIPDFEVAMTVLTTVISQPKPGWAILDLGVKGAGAEFGPPRVKDHPEIEIPFFLSEEHTRLQDTPDWRVGQTVMLVPSHACTTCNLYRCFHVHANGRIVDVWPIEASGRLD